MRRRILRCASRMLPLGVWDLYAVTRRIPRGRARADMRAGQPAGLSGGVAGSFSAQFFAHHALERLLPFWQRHAVDPVHGGFDTLLDRRGERYGDGTRYAAMQGRMIHAFCQGHWLDPTGEWLATARLGRDYLIGKFWDRTRGGWFSSVHPDGRVRDPRKDLFHQAFAIVGLAEYARAAGDRESLNYAMETLELVDRHAWDAVHGGYRESFTRNWSTLSSEKTLCIQLDMLQALLLLHEVTERQSLVDRSLRLAGIITGRMLDRRLGLLLETFSQAWQYRPARTHDVVWVGHSLKAARLLLLLSAHLVDPERDRMARRLVDRCLRAGWDAAHGGFFHQVFRRGCLASTEKLWWTQCEGILALCELAARRLPYLSLLERLCAFTFGAFHDADHLEWYTSCNADGSARDDRKGGPWKSAYHPVQACFGASRALRGMGGAAIGGSA
jgi:mannobiose 2-epimerase